ncbi:MAG: DUF1992 domain-containing protein [Deltaproteobacteria bacterium]|jgi:hypothetical protein|nr:DUF1992 domain-containing protein [Deltaproteobacteria bacterium]
MYTLDAIALVAEEKIREAQLEGAFDHLPGAGKPLRQDDDDRMPPEMRMAWKILKNSGYLAEADKLKITRENQEEALEHRRLTRFAVRYSRVKQARLKAESGPAGKRRTTGTEEIDGLDAVLEVTMNKTLEDSPYFAALLKKVQAF